MDGVLETPAKRRKLDGASTMFGSGYNSPEDDGDNLLNDYETVATVPLDLALPAQSITQRLSSPSAYVTQPTQILNTPQKRGFATGDDPVVQVAASSPTPASVQKPRPAPAPMRNLGNAMAPAGTAFRLPMVQKPTPVDADSSDDEGPTYRGGLSDEESQQPRSDIKPSKFTKSARPVGPQGQAPGRFGEIIAGSFYKPMDNNRTGASSFQGSVYDQRNRNEGPTVSRIPAAPMRSVDVMANAYGGVRKPINGQPVPPQSVRHVAQPAKKTLTIDEIEDANSRKKVRKMVEVYPHLSIKACLRALEVKRFHYDDAMDYLLTNPSGPPEIDLTNSDDELTSPSKLLTKQASAKQQLKAPTQSIQDKFAADQALARSTKQQLKKPKQEIDKKYAKEQALAASQPSSSLVAPPPGGRRLMTGAQRAKMQADRARQTHVETPPLSPKPQERVPEQKSTRAALEDITGPAGSAKIEADVLKFLNECTSSKLRDNINCTDDVAKEIISHKFFSDLDEVREITAAAPKNTVKNKKSRVAKNIGEKVVEKLFETFQGYAAVDVLVSVCEDFGKSVAEGMAKWGVDVFGQASKGELEIVNIDKKPSEQDCQKHDSGIGTPASTDDESVKINDKTNAFLPQPKNMGSSVILKDYQIVGFNWLLLLFSQKKSCILADDMGLGKTCQVVAFLAALLEQGNYGPHLVVVPGSTIENWMREFRKFCPALQVELYVGGQAERWAKQSEIKAGISKINVLLTTYTMAKGKEDSKFLRKIDFQTCIFDEGHMLKNCKSEAYRQMMKLNAQFRLLLTGTPLQNNLMELTSLLSFLNYSMFKEFEEPLNFIFSHKATTTGNDHEALLSIQRTARAKTMLTPFVLRRKKHQVLKDLPRKTRRIEYCDMTTSQQNLLEEYTQQVAQINADRLAGKPIKPDVKSNILMSLRKAAIHPLLFRVRYSDTHLSKLSKECIKIPEFRESNIDFIYEDLCVMTDWELHQFCIRYPLLSRHSLPLPESVLDSGKVTTLIRLLTTYKSSGSRCLIFSQFVLVLNLLEPILDTHSISYFRLDGATKMAERQDMIDQFYEDESVTAFMLSTKAGGAGINLAAADKVIIFDSSFNPQDDIQAENRAHRVGQIRDVEVVRLVSRGTIEEKILKLGQAKMDLDDKVAGVSVGDDKGGNEEAAKGEDEGVEAVPTIDEKEAKRVEERGMKAIEEEIFSGS